MNTTKAKERFEKAFERYGISISEDEDTFRFESPEPSVILTFIESELLLAHQSGREETLEQVSSWIAEGCAETDTMIDLAKFLRKKLTT